MSQAGEQAWWRKRPMGLTGCLSKIQDLLLGFKQNSSKITTRPIYSLCQNYFSFISGVGQEGSSTAHCSEGDDRGPAKPSCRKEAGARLLYKPPSCFPRLTSSACLGIRAGPRKQGTASFTTGCSRGTTHCSLSQATREPGSGPT